MPIERSAIRRDGHAHPRRTDEVDTTYLSVPRPRRSPNTGSYRQAPTTDSMMTPDEAATRTRFDYSTQDIISLEPKSQKRQPSRRLPPTRQSSKHLIAARQPSKQFTSPRPPTKQLIAEKPSVQRSQRQFHWLVPTGITIIITIACYLLLYSVWTGGRSVYNDLAYGATTPTSQMDAVVGYQDSSSSPTHFMAMNLHGTIDIIVFPGGDVTHAKVYPGPHLLWSNANKAVVTMEVKDVNGDQKPDIVIHVQGDTDLLFRQTTANFVLLNNGSGFLPMRPLQP